MSRVARGYWAPAAIPSKSWSPGAGLSHAEQLHRFGMGIMTFLASKPATDFYAVVAGELRRHTELARIFYGLGPGRTRANLAGLLAAGMDGGELVQLDPAQAADELFGLWQGFTNFQFALGIDVEAVHAGLEARVRRGVQVFLNTYGVPPDQRVS